MKKEYNFAKMKGIKNPYANSKKIPVRKSISRKLSKHNYTAILTNRKLIAETLLECLENGDFKSFQDIAIAYLRTRNKKAKRPYKAVRK